MPKHHVFPNIYKTTITVTVLSEGPYKWSEVNGLAAVAYDITHGDCIGSVTIAGSQAAPLLRDQAIEACYEMGSSPEFFHGLVEAISETEQEGESST